MLDRWVVLEGHSLPKKTKEDEAVRVGSRPLLREKQRGWKGGAADGCVGRAPEAAS